MLPKQKGRSSILCSAGKMAFLLLAALCCMTVHHLYYSHLNRKAPGELFSLSKRTGWTRNQAVASDVGIALAYASQSFLFSAVAFSSTQLFWRRIRSHEITISQIDALMSVQVNAFSPSLISALRALPNILLLALLGTSMAGLSVITPGSIKVSDNFGISKECAVQTPRDLTTLPTFTGTDSDSPNPFYRSPIVAVLSTGTYLPPINLCSGGLPGGAGYCSYNLEFVGPGFDCEDVTALSNEIAFTTPVSVYGITKTDLFNASTPP